MSMSMSMSMSMWDTGSGGLITNHGLGGMVIARGGDVGFLPETRPSSTFFRLFFDR
jgi:hypothetical protein